MNVVDAERSERGRQRRKAANGRLLHCCCICGRLDTWGDGWTAYCSVKDIEDGELFPKFCSDACRAKGGRNARNVTDEMLGRAKDAEMREPTIVYRAATDREKYMDACSAQRKRRRDRSASRGAE